MVRRIVLYLIRKKLRVKKWEKFKFVEQKRAGIYHFTDDALVKEIGYYSELSGVSLNYLLSDECKIVKLDNK